MKTTNNFKNTVKKIAGLLLILILPCGFTDAQLSSEKSMWKEIKALDKIIRDIEFDRNESSYLIYQNKTGAYTASDDDMQQVEFWMIDLGCWKSNESGALNDLLCIQEYEFDYPVEKWMLTEFATPAVPAPDNVDEEKIHLEDWMVDPCSWSSTN